MATLAAAVLAAAVLAAEAAAVTEAATPAAAASEIAAGSAATAAEAAVLAAYVLLPQRSAYDLSQKGSTGVHGLVLILVWGLGLERGKCHQVVVQRGGDKGTAAFCLCGVPRTSRCNKCFNSVCVTHGQDETNRCAFCY